VKNDFDLMVIGGGSGGLASAQRAAEYGANVAVIEQAPLGGTCVNVGCVPKKVMWYAAQHTSFHKLAADYGFDIKIKSHDWAQLKKKRDAYIKRLNGIYERNLKARNIQLIRGPAKFKNQSTVTVNDIDYSSQKIVIATGGKPIVPEISGGKLGIDSDGFFALNRCPSKVAIIGSGYIAVELAGVLAALGAEVSLFIRTKSLIRSFDAMLSEKLKSAMQHQGIKVIENVTPYSLEGLKNNLFLRSEDQEQFGSFEEIIWAVGRSPNTDNINLSATAVAVDKNAFITTDKFQETNITNIFAIGDVTGREALTPVAIAAGRRLSDRLFGGMSDRYLEYHTIPTVVFSHPPIGTVGITETMARKKFGDKIKIFTSSFTPMFYALSDEEDKIPTTMKLITLGDEQKVIGCHIIGDGADEMLQGFAVAIRKGLTKKDFDDTIAIHPTSAEELVTMR
jgi:glutathione reductase (NADPH)|tara:strand:- start:4505 stop:5857 length:1353 start_codon:yes stop_codon:yes gene_type:complete